MCLHLLPLYWIGYIVAGQEGRMLRRAFIAVSLFCWAGAAFGGTVVDATGRSMCCRADPWCASGRPTGGDPVGSGGTGPDVGLELTGV